MIREALTQAALDALDPSDAAALFIARRADGLTAHEQALLDAWLAADEAHQTAFKSADRAWRSMDAAEEDEIVAAMRAQALAPRQPTQRLWRPAAMAAGLAAALAALVIFVPALNPWGNPAQVVEYATARAQVTAIELPDGSHVTLDAESALEGRFDERSRTIELARGRALFDVAEDASRPFVVSVGERRVVAVGTRFDVNVVGDALTVTLVEGRVDVEIGAATPVSLQAGQQLIERHGEVSVRSLGPGAAMAIGWGEGVIAFDDQPLNEAAAIMNRYSREQIVLGNGAVERLRVSGQFPAGETERFAATLAEMHGLRVSRQGDRIELAGPQ